MRTNKAERHTREPMNSGANSLWKSEPHRGTGEVAAVAYTFKWDSGGRGRYLFGFKASLFYMLQVSQGDI